MVWNLKRERPAQIFWTFLCSKNQRNYGLNLNISLDFCKIDLMFELSYFKWKPKQNKRKNRLDTEHLKSKIVQNNLTLFFSWCHVFLEKRLDKQMKIDDSTITYVLFYMKTKFARCYRFKVHSVHWFLQCYR